MYETPPQPPPLFIGTKESILADAKAICDRWRKMLDSLVATISPDDQSATTFDAVMRPQIREEHRQTNVLDFYQYVSADSELRDASTEAAKLIADMGVEAYMREDVFRLVDAVYQRSGVKAAVEAAPKDEPSVLVVDGLDSESARCLKQDHKTYLLKGLSLPAGPQRDRFKDLTSRRINIAIEFTKNLNEETGGVWFTPEELDGVPQDVVDSFKKGGDGEEEKGKVRVTFKYPDLLPTMKFAKNSETRMKLSVANDNRCNQNIALFREMILLRDEGARMLGYPDHATLALQDKMVKTPKAVLDFLGDLRTRLTPGGQKDKAQLLEIKKADLAARDIPFDGKLYIWDRAYYHRLMVERDYSVDEVEVSNYFPLKSTVTGMLAIFAKLFGLVFVELDSDARARLSPTGKAEDVIWHEDVIMFSVWNDHTEGDGFVGYLYLDLHPRTGKYGHAAKFGLESSHLKEDGKTRYFPVAALVCNFPKPTPSKPSLLTHGDVVTLFHELGHGIHDLATITQYARSTDTTRDFVEAPSQMLENWCWTAGPLKLLSSHYETGQPIPDDLVGRLIATRHVNDALWTLRQLHLGLFDMTVHTAKSHAELEQVDFSALYNDLYLQICGIHGPEALGGGNTWGHGQATFGHLLGGYDAGYYGYLSSQVYSADMFYSVFRKDPMDGVQGRRYRHTVLERGGSQDEMLTLMQFLGRKPKPDAFYAELGLGDAQPAEAAVFSPEGLKKA